MAQILDSAGNVVFPAAPTGSYMIGFNIRQTGTDAAASVLLAIRNPAASTKTVFIRHIRGIVGFDGTAAAGGSIGYDFIRFSGGDPSSGTTLTRAKKRSAYAASQILDANAQFKVTALTMTGVTVDPNGAFHAVRLPISVTNGSVPFDINFVTAGTPYEGLELAVGEGLAIRAAVTSVAGQGIGGSIEWDER